MGDNPICLMSFYKGEVWRHTHRHKHTRTNRDNTVVSSRRKLRLHFYKLQNQSQEEAWIRISVPVLKRKQPCRPPELRLLPLVLWDNNFLLFNLQVYGILLWQPEWMNTPREQVLRFYFSYISSISDLVTLPLNLLYILTSTNYLPPASITSEIPTYISNFIQHQLQNVQIWAHCALEPPSSPPLPSHLSAMAPFKLLSWSTLETCWTFFVHISNLSAISLMYSHSTSHHVQSMPR